VKPVDAEMFDVLDQSAVSYQIVLTKHDELKAAERAEVVAATLEALAKRPAAFPEIVFTSAHKGEGIPELRAAVSRLLAERGA
jgi:GTP-binding protein